MRKITLGNVTIGEGIPKICAPLTGTTETTLREQCKEIRKSEAHIAEWRVDFFSDNMELPHMNELLAQLKQELGRMPLIFTFRTAAEGGEKEITAEDYVLLNKQAIDSGQIDLVDIELFRGEAIVTELINYAKEKDVYTIVSNHDFEKTPAKEEILSRLNKAVELGADLPKIAVMPKTERDVLTLLDSTLTMKENKPNQPIITMSMGKLGLLSRLSGELFGSALTFGTIGKASAPGQIAIDSLDSCLEILHIAK